MKIDGTWGNICTSYFILITALLMVYLDGKTIATYIASPLVLNTESMTILRNKLKLNIYVNVNGHTPWPTPKIRNGP